MLKTAFVQITFYRDWSKTIQHVERLSKFDTLDYIIIVVDQTVHPDQIENLKRMYRGKPKLIVKQVEFRDNIPEFRNHYVEECKRLGVKYFITSDPDEWICEELFRDLRKIIEWAEEQGYTQLGLNCKEKFTDIEWLDELDKLKEAVQEIRESNYFKFLINKICCEKFRYEGVGTTKNVHETWGCPVHPQRGTYLPRKYYYIHEKSTYDIWRNGARNFVISGGDDNCGDLNEMWVEFRKIVKEKLGIDSWTEFERYIKSGKELPKELIDWIKRALVWKATDYGIETRQTAKWIIFHHRYLLNDPEIKRGIENPPKMTPEDEVEMYVRKVYFQVLGRHPDRPGLEFWKRQILEGKVRKEDLPRIFMASPEYREKFGIPIQLPTVGPVQIRLRPEDFIRILARNPIFFESIKPALDIGKFILNNIKNRDEFLKWFYMKKPYITLEELMQKIRECT